MTNTLKIMRKLGKEDVNGPLKLLFQISVSAKSCEALVPGLYLAHRDKRTHLLRQISMM